MTALIVIAGHLFHKDCIQRLHSGRTRVVACPICRKVGSSGKYNITEIVIYVHTSPRNLEIIGSFVREIFLTSARQSPRTGTDSDTGRKKDLEEALQNKAIAERNLARARTDNLSLIRQTRDLLAKEEEQKQQLERQKEVVLVLLWERDDAIASLSELLSERDTLTAKVFDLEEQKGVMERRITRHSELENLLSNSLRKIKEDNTADVPSRPTSQAPSQPRTSRNPFTM